jgi:hypothetical protein
MNKSRMKKNAWSHVRFRPVAKRFYGAEGLQLSPVDDDWLIRRARWFHRSEVANEP